MAPVRAAARPGGGGGEGLAGLPQARVHQLVALVQGDAPTKRRGTRRVAAREQAWLRAAQYTARESQRQELAVRYLMACEDTADREAAV